MGVFCHHPKKVVRISSLSPNNISQFRVAR